MFRFRGRLVHRYRFIVHTFTSAPPADATVVPLHTARLCLEALGLIHFVATNGNINAMSDAASAAFMARAAIDAAGMNVRINAATLDDKPQAQRYVDELKNIQTQALMRVDQVLVEVEKRATLA